MFNNIFFHKNHSNQDWTPILDRMQKPARITDSEKELIGTYLDTNSKK